VATSRRLGPRECHKLQTKVNSYRIKSENETLNKKLSIGGRRWSGMVCRRYDVVRQTVTDLPGGGATGNALLPITVCKRTEGTARRAVAVERETSVA